MPGNHSQDQILLLLTECQPAQVEVVPELEAVGVMSAVIAEEP
jgi:hypothetical protein